jgi:hypothetical protein
MDPVTGNTRRFIIFHKGGISMQACCDPILAEVMENKAKLLEMYGGIEGLDKHQEEERPRLEMVSGSMRRLSSIKYPAPILNGRFIIPYETVLLKMKKISTCLLALIPKETRSKSCITALTTRLSTYSTR